jgi:hypothetical protein
MAPEQFAGDRADRRTDVYSLGVMFYRMVTGGLPFTGATARETLTQRLTEPPRPLASAAPHLAFPDGLQAVVDRALSRRPEDRYPTAGEFASALREATGGPAPVADVTPTVRLDAATAPIATASPATQPTRSRRRTGALVGIGVVLAGAVGVALLQKPGGTGSPGSEPPAPVGAPASAAPPSAPVATKAESAVTRLPARDTARPTGRRQDTLAARPPAGTPPPPVTIPAESPLPALPTPDEILSPETQDASRARAEQIYGRADAEAVLRAQAAFIVATIQGERGRYAEAETWAVRAVMLNEEAPPGAERDRRDERYRAFINQIRRLRGTSDS